MLFSFSNCFPPFAFAAVASAFAVVIFILPYLTPKYSKKFRRA